MDNDTPASGETEQPVEPQEPATESVELPCACGKRYTFDVTADTTRFTVVCKGCGTALTWER